MPSTKRNNSAFRSGPFSNSGIKSRTHLLANRSTTLLEGHPRFQGFGIIRFEVFIVTKRYVLDISYLYSYDKVNRGKHGPGKERNEMALDKKLTMDAAVKLFPPLQVGPLELKQRIMLASLTRMRATQPGNVPGALNAEYYAQRTSTGGLLISEATQISVPRTYRARGGSMLTSRRIEKSLL